MTDPAERPEVQARSKRLERLSEIAEILDGLHMEVYEMECETGIWDVSQIRRLARVNVHLDEAKTALEEVRG